MSKKSNSLENLFDFMKSLGEFSEYKDYADFQAKKFGRTSEKNISELAENVEIKDLLGFAKKMEQEKPEPKEKFEDSLSDKEREDYEYIFEND